MATTTTAIKATTATDVLVRPSRSLWSNAWWKLRHDRLTLAAFVVLCLLALLAAAADLLADNVFQYSFAKQDLLHTYEKPALDPIAYLLGTDEIGRSQVVRLLYGGRVSLAVGFVAALVNLTIGVVLGLSAGYFRGVVDDLFTWFVTTLQSIPTLFLLLIIGAIWEPGPVQLTIIIGALFWTGISLYCRGQTFSLREREFVIAARTIGARDRRIMFNHILPNILPLIFVLAAIDVGGIILAESALSFLGLGILPPTPSWGNMLTGATNYFVRAPWLVYPPGAMIFLTVLCLYLIGDGLRDALDPRVKGREG
ncbi:MAG TPA: ABC transporter permease [Candidatus Limnocylindria bacterium]|nr:ABC transporter permease [Candidatus Limnocylindria bacterium]